MPHSDLEKIFEPFYTKKAMGRSGTGLGMSVVWGTVKDHEGYIDIITEEGTGTTFVLYLPASRSKKEAAPSVYIEDYLGRGESVLVIDDSPEQRELAKRMMRRLGYDVHTAGSGEAAVALIKEQSHSGWRSGLNWIAKIQQANDRRCYHPPQRIYTACPPTAN